MAKSVPTHQKLKSMQTRKRIYKAAVRLLEKYEYTYLTVRNICDEAGLSIGTFYHHFTSKDDLLSFYIADGYVSYAKLRDPGPIDDVCEAIMAKVDIYLSYYLETDFTFLCKYHTTDNKSIDTRNRHSEKQLAKTPFVKEIITLVAAAQSDGYITQAIPSGEIADDIITLTKGGVFEWCLSSGTLDLKRMTQRLVKCYLSTVITDRYREKYPSFCHSLFS